MEKEKKQVVPNKRLRDEREKRGWTRAYMAEQLNLADPKTVGRWERGVASPNAYFRRKLCAIFQLDPQQLGLAQSYQGRGSVGTEEEERSAQEDSAREGDSTAAGTQTYWSVPYRHNPFFTGREALLEALDQHLHAEQAVVLAQAVTLHGLGGIGKTQVALEYAYQYGQRYQAVFWIEAETIESLHVSFLRLANTLELPECSQEKQEQIVVAVQRWLSLHPNWLLIWDNVEESERLTPFLPSSPEGKMLFTTRLQMPGAMALSVEIPTLPLEQAVQLLMKRAHLLNINATQEEGEQLKASHPDEHRSATELSELLDGLPLALDQAGAYLEETGCSITDYLLHFRQQRKRVLQRRGSHAGIHPASVVTTLALAIKRVEQMHPLATDFLQVCAFLYPENIPEEIFTTGAAALGQAWEELGSDPYQFDLLLAAVRSASLIRRDAKTHTLSLHRLVQAMLQDQMEQSEARLWKEHVICVLNAVLPDGKFENWGIYERSVVQARAAVVLVQEENIARDEAGMLLHKVGGYLLERGRYREAEPLLEQAVQMAERQYGPTHLELVPRLTKLGELFWQQGWYEQVETLLMRVLKIQDQWLEPEHPQRAETLSSLALMYWHQGKYEQAEPLYQYALHIQEKQQEPDLVEMAITLNNFGLLYFKQKKYEQAEALHQRALALREQQLGPEHPQVAISLRNLAAVYRVMKRYEQAEQFYQRVLQIREKLLGADHPHTTRLLNDLAGLYREQGKYEQAEVLYQKALQIRMQTLDAEHPTIATTLSGLAQVYQKQEKYEQAKILYQRALSIQTRRLGTSHPDVAETLKGLEALYQEQAEWIT